LARDLAIDYNTGDLIIAPTKDLDLRTGSGTIEQRIRVRLKVWGGEWDINPTLGSRLYDVIRMPNWRAVNEIELAVREALEPMEDITIQNVRVELDEDDARVASLAITYASLDPGNELVDNYVLTTSLRVGD
jgi:phage baseplate assembly protein W